MLCSWARHSNLFQMESLDSDMVPLTNGTILAGIQMSNLFPNLLKDGVNAHAVLLFAKTYPSSCLIVVNVHELPSMAFTPASFIYFPLAYIHKILCKSGKLIRFTKI